MLKDKRTKAIYHYLTESVSDKELKELVDELKDYVDNGSFIDYEIDDDKTLTKIIDKLYDLLGF